MEVATGEDVWEIASWLERCFQEANDKKGYGLKVDFDSILKSIEGMIAHPDTICFMSSDGVILGRMTETWFGPNLFAEEYIFYVKPEARGSGQALRLINAFEEEAKARGGIGVHYSYLSGFKPEGFDQFLMRRGCINTGGVFLKFF